MEEIEFAIVGAGILGISIAKELSSKFFGSIVLFEKEFAYGDHTSGRNSGVLHSGIYYETGSLKHKLCLSGIKKWRENITKYGIPSEKCGKFIFSTIEQEEEIQNLFQMAQKNSIGKFRWATVDEISNLSVLVNLKNAIFIEETSIIDQAFSMKVLLNEFEKNGGIYLSKHSLINIIKENDYFILEFENKLKVKSKYVINCAGLWGVDIRKKLNLNDISNYYVKGNYIKLIKKLDIESLVYPIPEKNLKGLGVHLTIDLDGNVKFGPNVEDVGEINYRINERKLDKMIEYILKTYNKIDREDIQIDYCGIRPKVKKNGVLVNDFIIQSPLKNYIECLGIESPGFTAAPAIADYVCGMIGAK